MLLLRSAAVLLTVVICASNALFVREETLKRAEKWFKAQERADLCAAKAAAKTYCFPGGVFSSTLCSPSVVTSWLIAYDTEAQNQYNADATAQWKYQTNITDENVANANAVSEKVSEWFVSQMIEAMRFPLDRPEYSDEAKAELKRIVTTNSLCDSTEMNRVITLNSQLGEGYSKITACIDKLGGKCLTGQGQFAAEMSKATDYELLRELWVKYTNGAKVFRTDFTERLGLLNKGARENGFPDNGYYEWFTDVGDEEFIPKMKELLRQIDPLYRQLHAYVRHKLSQAYPGKVDVTKAIPVHLTRNMYGQTWGDLIGIVKPYPNVSDTDITQALQTQNYTTLRIFNLSEVFFTDLGCDAMTPTFWKESMLEQPVNLTVECHGSAWDFQLTDDYRIKMCTTPTMSDFTTVHHEMGHVVYFMEYRPLEFVYRDGGQSGFHEAIGDTITLSVLTPEHLHVVGLLDEPPKSEDFDINFLMTTALDKLPFFSFAIMMDLWRWDTYNETIKPDQYNKKWWRMRLELGGIAPPAEDDRSSEDFFDPGAKFHVTNNVPYIRYFMSYFLQFQFYEAMCKAKGYTGDLHRCDFAGSKEAGAKLRKLMQHGRKTYWKDQLFEMTGKREISAESFMLYYDKLYKWLVQYNTANVINAGWEVPPESSAPRSTSYLLSLTFLPLLLGFSVRL